jgi:hypothetical protein
MDTTAKKNASRTVWKIFRELVGEWKLKVQYKYFRG